MVRIFCLTSIIKSEDESSSSMDFEEPGKNSEEPEKNFNAEDFFNPENNTKVVMEKIKKDPSIFNSYKLTEICIGYHYISGNDEENGEKAYFMLIYRKDTGLIVTKMAPGSVSFHSKSRQVHELKIFISKLYQFNLLIKLRCIKNTKVRIISADEIKLYEEYAEKIESFSKNKEDLQETAFEMFEFQLPNESVNNVLRTKISDINTSIRLLCDPEDGSAENVRKSSRLNHKAKCLWITLPLRNIEPSSSKDMFPESSDCKKDFENQEGATEEVQTNHFVSLEVNEQSEITSKKNEMEKFFRSLDTLQSIEKKDNQRLGRPKMYITEDERKAAHLKAAKKYYEKYIQEFQKLKDDVVSLEKLKSDLHLKLKHLMNSGSELSEEQRNRIQKIFDRINESTVEQSAKTLEPCSTIPSSAKNVDIVVSNKSEKQPEENVRRENLDKVSMNESKDAIAKRRKQQQTAVVRARKRRKEERELLEETKTVYLQQTKSLQILIEYIEKTLETISTKNLIIQKDDEKQVNVTNNEGLVSEENADEHHNPDDAEENKCGDNANPCKLVQILSKVIDNWKEEDTDVTILNARRHFTSKMRDKTRVTSNFVTLTRLKLQKENITAVCDCFFQMLPGYLTFMDLSLNNISTISTSISRLTNLKELHLNDNENLSIDGIPWKFLPHSLKKLKFGRNSMQEIPDLAHLPNLSWLEMNSNKIKEISNGILKFQSLNFLELENNYISSLPEGFETLISLQYLNLRNNSFHHEKDDLEKILWKRLPQNISVLILDNNPLLNLPCSLTALKKLRNLAVNGCDLEYICPFIATSVFAAEKDIIFEIADNPRIAQLPFLPKIFYKSDPCQWTSYHNHEHHVINSQVRMLNLVTDSQFLKTKVVRKNKITLYKFQICEENDDNNSCCKCCGKCGKETDAKMLESVMIMDFNLCLKKEQNANFHEENGNIEDIYNNRHNKIKKIRDPGEWKTKIRTRLCSECYDALQNEIEKSDSVNINAKDNENNESLKRSNTSFFVDVEEKRKRKSISDQEEYNAPQLISQHSSITHFIPEHHPTFEYYRVEVLFPFKLGWNIMIHGFDKI